MCLCTKIGNADWVYWNIRIKIIPAPAKQKKEYILKVTVLSVVVVFVFSFFGWISLCENVIKYTTKTNETTFDWTTKIVTLQKCKIKYKLCNKIRLQFVVYLWQTMRFMGRLLLRHFVFLFNIYLCVFVCWLVVVYEKKTNKQIININYTTKLNWIRNANIEGMFFGEFSFLCDSGCCLNLAANDGFVFYGF